MEYRFPKFNAVGSIDCEINHPVYGWIPFTASANDVEDLGREVYELVSKGAVAAYVANSGSLDQLASAARAKRDQLLRDTDWSQLADVPLPVQAKYSVYRQALREIPQQPEFPITISWPAMP